MLYVWKEKSRVITKAERKGNALYLYSELATHRIVPYRDRCIRLSYTYGEDFSKKEKPGVIAVPSAEWTFSFRTTMKHYG